MSGAGQACCAGVAGGSQGQPYPSTREAPLLLDAQRAHLASCAGAVTPLRGDHSADKVVTKGEVLSKNGGLEASSASASSSSSSDNGCTDVAPKGSTCQQQKVGWGPALNTARAGGNAVPAAGL